LTHRLLPHARLTGASSWLTRPLRSLGFSPSSSLLRVAPSLCFASIRCGFLLDVSLHIEATGSRSAQRPGSESRHLYAGCHPGKLQNFSICPGSTTRPGFDTVPTLSTRSWWFTAVRLSEPYLTRSCRAVSGHAHHPGSLPEQLPVVWSLPCRPAPRGRPSSLVQQGCIESTALLHRGLLAAPSWRTVIRESLPPR
jgi:hypothetical protein